MQKPIPATHILLAVNVIVFLLVQLPVLETVAGHLPLFHPEHGNFGAWQFVTSMFMHGNLTHLFFNMFGLFSFGTILEVVWGKKRFVMFYFAAGIGAGLVYTGVNLFENRMIRSQLEETGVSLEMVDQVVAISEPNDFLIALNDSPLIVHDHAVLEDVVKLYRIHNIPVVGASGAIYGILTAFGMLFPDAKLRLIFLPIPVAAKFFIPAILLLDLFSGITGFSIFGGGIAHFAHIGGAVIGFLLMLAWRKDLSLPPEIRAQM